MAAAAAAEAVLSSIKPVSSLASAASALTDEQLSILQFLCNKNLERAMRILDLGGVERVVAEPSKRTVFRDTFGSMKEHEVDKLACILMVFSVNLKAAISMYAFPSISAPATPSFMM